MRTGDWKKVSSTDSHSLFKSAQGHEIKVAHSALEPKLKKQLFDIPHYYEAGAVEGNTDPAPEPSLQDKIDSAVNSSNSAANDASAAAVTDQQSQESPGSLWAGPSPASADTSGAFLADTNPTSTDTTTPGVPSPYNMGAGLQGQIAGIREQGLGQQQEQAALGQLGTQQAQQEQAYQNTQQDAFRKYNESNDALNKERMGIQQDIQNGHIDPKKYIDSMSTGKAIRTGIGLVLGGMGAGLTHGPNLAFQYLQSQIDRDIDAQKVELGKKQNLLSNNLMQTGNLRAATALTQLHNNDMLSSALKQEADAAQDPLSKSRILQIKGLTDQKSSALQNQLNMMHALSGGNGGNIPLEMLPADQRERAVQLPGGGLRLATTKEGAKEVRDQLQSIGPIFNQLDELSGLGKAALVSGTPANARAQSITASLIPAINENAGLKRLSAEDIGNIKKMITDPTQLSTLITGPAKTQQFKSFIQSKLMSTMANQLEGGMPQQQAAQGTNSNPQAYLAWAKKNPGNPKAAFILKHYGAK